MVGDEIVNVKVVEWHSWVLIQATVIIVIIILVIVELCDSDAYATIQCISAQNGRL